MKGEIKMKVLLVNGGPHKNGCVNTALEEVAKTLEEEGIDTEIFWIGIKPIAGCIACKKKSRRFQGEGQGHHHVRHCVCGRTEGGQGRHNLPGGCTD